MPTPGPIDVVLLAAGRSRRMLGTNKLLLPVDGEPLVRRNARIWLEAGHHVVVVTAADDGAVCTALDGLAVDCIGNPRTDEGPHTSIATGIAASPLASRALAVALADQPLLTGSDIAALVSAFDEAGGNSIVIPRHLGERGNPVLLPVAVARTLQDDPALGPPRRYIDTHPDQVCWLDVAHDRYTTDIDTPEDSVRLLGRKAARP